MAQEPEVTTGGESATVMPRLEDWYESVGCLHGRVYGHPNFEDGTDIHTSEVVSMDGQRATTRNTVYALGVQRGGYKPAIDALNQAVAAA